MNEKIKRERMLAIVELMEII
jgi:hypothetical protein